MSLIQRFCIEDCPYGSIAGCKILKMLNNNDDRCPAWLFAQFLRQEVVEEFDTEEDQ